MKKIIFSLLSLLICFTWLPGYAQTGLGSNQRVIGHTVSDEYDYSGVMFGTAGTYPVGALLYPNTLSFYKGCKIVGIRVAAAMDLGRTKMFLTDINTGDLYTPTQRLYEGWNNIFFNGDGYTITGEETLFYGLNYVETEEMVNAETGGLVCMQEATDGGFMIEQGGALYPISGVGDLCVQLIVDISSLPSKNMTVSVMDTGFKYKKSDEMLDIFFQFMNVGREKIDSFTVAISFDGETPETFNVEEGIEPGGIATWEQYLSMPENLGVGNHTITGYISEIEGTPVQDPAKTAKKASFALYQNSMSRDKVYVEVYSDQSNVYSSMMDDVNNDLRDIMKDKMAIVQVHAPGTTLAVPEAAWLHEIYAYTTPTFTSNRAYFPGETHIAYDLNDFLGLLPGEFISGIMEDVVMQDYYNPAFANLQIEGNYNAATRQLDLSATGTTLPEAEAIYGKLALTLIVVEDGVTARQVVLAANNRTKVDQGYTHNNVLRGFITASKGDALTVDNNNFTANYSYTLPANMDPSKVRIVGLLTKAGDDINMANAPDYDVINTAEVNVSDISGIAEIFENGEKEIEGVYTLDGLRLDKSSLSSPGLHIIRYTDGSARKVVVK